MAPFRFRLDFIVPSFAVVLVAQASLGCHSKTTPVVDPAPEQTDVKASDADTKPDTKPETKSEEIVFHDEVESNVEAPVGLDGLVFFSTSGDRVALKDYVGKKNVVLVFTEGFNGMLCPFCKTQTSRLVANYGKFKQTDTEVLVVYPGTRSHLDEFIDAARTTGKKQVDAVPFPILLDEDFGATEYFKIRSNLAHPSTFIIDKAGNVRLAYVGADMTADRPSIRAMLKVLQSANGS